MAEKKFSGLSKQQKMSKGTAYGKSFLKTENFDFFFQFWAFFYFKRKLSPDLQNPQSTCAWKFYGEKHFFENNRNFYTSLDFDPKNR